MLLAVVGFHSLIAKPFYIPSISMMPNLLVGDRLVVSKYPYGWSWVSASFHILPRGMTRILPRTPAYGDIVIVVPPDRDEDYIKRVVALPGDRIAVVNGQIILNGKPVPQQVEPPLELPVDLNQPCDPDDFPGLRYRANDGRWYCELPILRETLPNGATYRVIDHRQQPLDNYAEVKVPQGYVFLMGDNRDHSADSRAPIEERVWAAPSRWPTWAGAPNSSPSRSMAARVEPAVVVARLARRARLDQSAPEIAKTAQKDR
jgi:signal peptidase I